MKRVGRLVIIVAALALGLQASRAGMVDDFVAYTQRHPAWANGSWWGFRNGAPADGKVQTILAEEFGINERDCRIIAVCECPSPIDTEGSKFALVEMECDKRRSLLVISKVLPGEWRFRSFDAESRKMQTAEPGATDNPDDAQRLREDH